MALLAVAAMVAGCGSEVGAARTTDDSSGGGTAVGGGGTELTVVVKAGPGQRTRTYTLTCDPPAGDHPNPEAACQQLSELEDPFAPVSADTACTEIYGGPQTATVTGTFRGEPVSAQFSRTDGCQIARWDAHVALLVEAGGAQGS